MKKALLIGINYYDISGITLKGCINDIINMRNMLIDAYDYEPNNITMLRDDDPQKFALPTHDNIYDRIITLVLESADLEEIWLHYSGHGSQLQNQNSEYSGEILIPVDYTTEGCITDGELYDMIRRIRCRAILTFDCCHSGTVCDLPWTTQYDSGKMVTTRINRAKINNPYIFMLSGCKDDQTSADTTNMLDQRMGAFTNALTECLRNSHHTTTIVTLHKSICEYLLKDGYSQIPILSSTVENPDHIIAKIRPQIHDFLWEEELDNHCPCPPPPTRNTSIDGTVHGNRRLKHQYKLGDFITHNGTHLFQNSKEAVERSFLPIISSGDSVSTPSLSTITTGISKMARHYYSRETYGFPRTPFP